MAPLLLMLLTSSGAGCGTTNAKPEPQDLGPDERSCMVDDECQISDFVGCCSCHAEPYAINAKALAKRTDICSVVECTCAPGTDCTCPKVADPAKFKPVCAQGTCRRQPI